MTTGWDIANVIAQSIGALGTMGALIVAVRVYRRQVDDQRREQAVRVVIAYDEDVTVTNHSDRPVRLLWAMGGPGLGRGFPVQPPLLAPGASRVYPGSAFEVEDRKAGTVLIAFSDARGRYWLSDSDGVLQEGRLPAIFIDSKRPEIGRRWTRKLWDSRDR